MVYFDSFADFLAMGGHGFYVWLSYGVVLGALIIQSIMVKSALNKAMKNIIKYYRRVETRQAKLQQNNKVL